MPSVPLESAPVWRNWTRDLEHLPAEDGKPYYFSPTTREELREVVLRATSEGVVIRVSGQRHSQPPLVADDNRDAPAETARLWLVDLSCYCDLGDGGDEQIVLDEDAMRVTVNGGVREDYLDAWLTERSLMLKTVTAGGFFSVGGMTAVDVNGASTDAPIFAETATAFTMMGADGNVRTVERGDEALEGWDAIQFVRVSLGALGILTAVTLEVVPRPYATTIETGRLSFRLDSEAAFVSRFQDLLARYDRLESFYDPYKNDFLVLWWKVVDNPHPLEPNPSRNPVPPSSTFAERGTFGAPLEKPDFEWVAERLDHIVQLAGWEFAARVMMWVAVRTVRKTFDASIPKHADLWLTRAARVAFMSYFVELPDGADGGLGRVWKCLQVVHERVQKKRDFLPTGPMEFRFVRGGDTALAGTYSERPDARFVNLDVLSFVEQEPVDHYPQAMLDFYADIERRWYGEFGGLPHNGKMYGFFDPSEGDRGMAMPPFATGYLEDLAKRRGERLEAFERYRSRCDPQGIFCNDFLRRLTLGRSGAGRRGEERTR